MNKQQILIIIAALFLLGLLSVGVVYLINQPGALNRSQEAPSWGKRGSVPVTSTSSTTWDQQLAAWTVRLAWGAAVVGFVLQTWAIGHLILNKKLRDLERIFYALVILLFHAVGAILYLLLWKRALHAGVPGATSGEAL